MSKPRPSLQRYFLSGLLTLLPLLLTVFVMGFVFRFLSDIGKPIVTPVLSRLATLYPESLGWIANPWVATTLGVVATIALILWVGVLAHRVLGQRLLRWFEALMQRIPFANQIYGGVRKLIDILQTKPEGANRVVLIDFPHKEMKSIGFVTRVLREQGTDRELAAVYVPTTPNPTSGYLEIVPLERLTPTDWSVDQAMSFIISGGAVSPATIPFDKPVPAKPSQDNAPAA